MEKIKEGEFNLNVPTQNVLLETLNWKGESAGSMTNVQYLKSIWEDMIEALWDGSIHTKWTDLDLSEKEFESKINTEFNLSEQYFWNNIVRGNVDDKNKPLFDWCVQKYSRDAEDSAQSQYESEHDL